MNTQPPEQWSKIEKIQFLLDSWDLIFDPNATAPYGSPGDGSGVPLLPKMARHASVRELERTLALLLIANAGDYRHLKAFRCGVEHRIVWRTTKVRGPHGKFIDSEPRPQRVKVMPTWIDVRLNKEGRVVGGRVQRAEAFLAEKFRGDVSIPDELYHALTCTNPDCRKCWPVFAAA